MSRGRAPRSAPENHRNNYMLGSLAELALSGMSMADESPRRRSLADAEQYQKAGNSPSWPNAARATGLFHMSLGRNVPGQRAGGSRDRQSESPGLWRVGIDRLGRPARRVDHGRLAVCSTAASRGDGGPTGTIIFWHGPARCRPRKRREAEILCGARRAGVEYGQLGRPTGSRPTPIGGSGAVCPLSPQPGRCIYQEIPMIESLLAIYERNTC